MKSLVLSVFVTCFASCLLLEATPAAAQTQHEKVQRKPTYSLLEFLSQPRFAAINLTESEDLIQGIGI